MPPYLYLLLLPITAAILLPILRRRLTRRALLRRPFDDNMTDLASWAVEVARTEHAITLDYSPDSVGKWHR